LSGVSTSRGPARELLVANHEFPGWYMIKAFGPGVDVFRAEVGAAVASVLGEERHRMSERSTRSGRKVCITVEVRAETVDEVLEIYDRLYALARLELIF
jgi:putative lipoic acid-binding regulatory protein